MTYKSHCPYIGLNRPPVTVCIHLHPAHTQSNTRSEQNVSPITRYKVTLVSANCSLD